MRTHDAHAARYFFVPNEHYGERAISINIIIFGAWFHRRMGFQPTEARSLCEENCFANEKKLGPGTRINALWPAAKDIAAMSNNPNPSLCPISHSFWLSPIFLSVFEPFFLGCLVSFVNNKPVMFIKTVLVAYQ